MDAIGGSFGNMMKSAVLCNIDCFKPVGANVWMSDEG